MSTLIENAAEYIAAVGKRQRLERLCREGQKEFSGYSRTVFENGIVKNIKSLDEAIATYEFRQGYSALAPYNFLTTHIDRQYLIVCGSTSFESCPGTLTNSVLGSQNTGSAPAHVREESAIGVAKKLSLNLWSTLATSCVEPIGAQ
jgi:hypothetical protein